MTRRPAYPWKICALLAVMGVVLAACGPETPVIKLDPTTTYQTITGWEATASMVTESYDKTFFRIRDEVYDRAVNEVGINRVRLEIRSGAENTNHAWSDYISGKIDYDTWRPRRYPTVNDNDDPFTINPAGFDFSELDFEIQTAVLPLKERLKVRGEKLFVNLCYVAFTDQITDGQYIHDDPEEYAEFMLATFQHMQQKFGFVPDTIEVILEPDLVKQWDGVTIGKAIVATAKRLEAAGFHPRFIAPSVTSMENVVPYLDQIASVEGAIDHMAEVSYHRYRGRSVRTLKKIAKAARKYNLATSMLEWWFGNATYDVLHEDLKIGNNTAWQGRALRGLFEIDTANPKQPVVKLQNDVRMNLQYFRYIRAGAKRIKATSTSGRRFNPVAFINTDGAYVVVVKASEGGQFELHNLPAGSYGISWATEKVSSEEDKEVAVDSDGVLTASIRDAGVVTIFQTSPTGG